MADEFGSDALIQFWNRLWEAEEEERQAEEDEEEEKEERALAITSAVLTTEVTRAVSLPELLVGVLVEKGPKTKEGDLIIGVTPAFRWFMRELARDPNALYHLDPRQFEELVAGGYDEEGWQVVLTPRSGDGGRDVIATRDDFGTIRVIDQVKLYSPHRVVEADDVRALYGVLGNDLGASKGVVTTTSRFARGVYKEFERQIPGRIQLRDGKALRDWLLRQQRNCRS